MEWGKEKGRERRRKGGREGRQGDWEKYAPIPPYHTPDPRTHLLHKGLASLRPQGLLEAADPQRGVVGGAAVQRVHQVDALRRAFRPRC